MSTFAEYDQYDGLGLAELVKRKEVTPLELVEAAVQRIEQFNGDVNAVVHKMYEQARLQATAVDLNSPFAGVPFLLKDLLAGFAGEPLRNGSRMYRNYVSEEDSPIVQRYRAAGVVVVGKSNTPEFGITPVTEPELFGPSNNPWDLTRTTGGSSGGSAAAVATRMVPLAHGGDGGGSIRIPSSCCGLFGLKPTRGRNPSSADYISWQDAVCEHVLTRSVRDSAAMLDLTAGPAPGEPYFAPPPAISFLDVLKMPPRKLRIAYTTTPFLGHHVSDECRQALEDTVTLCTELGHELFEASPQVDGFTFSKSFLTMLTGEIRADIDEAEELLGKKATPQEFETNTWVLGLLGGKLSAGDFTKALRQMQRTSYEIGRFFATNEIDVLLTPTLADPPVKTGALMPQGAEAAAMRVLGNLKAGTLLSALGGLDKAAETVYEWMPYTPLFNMTGQPAMSVPLYWTADNLPVGLQFVGRYADEGTLFNLAAQLEAARPWADRIPPLIKEMQVA